jgi:hypothetical protein
MTMTHMPDSNGGSVLLFALKIKFTRGPVLLPLVAKSAACMWLGYKDAYVDPKARFGFHRIRRDYTGIAEWIYHRHLKAAHPDLLEWFKQVGDNEDTLTYLTGEELIRRGWAKAA